MMTHMTTVGLNVDWANSIRALLLMNIDSTEGVYTIDLFMGKLLNKKNYTNSLRLLSLMADTRYTPEEYAATMWWVLLECMTVDTQLLHGDIDNVLRNTDLSKQTMVMRSIQTTHGRIRLRQRLSERKPGTVISNCDTLQGFQTSVNFSSTISSNTQLKAYVVMCQVAVNQDTVLERLLPPEIALTVRGHGVVNPELAVVQQILQRMQYTKAPFAALQEFHT
eukprot:2182384-Rhodomonas_salina.1